MQPLAKELVRLKESSSSARYNTFGANLRWVSGYPLNEFKRIYLIKYRDLIKQGVSISEERILNTIWDIDGEPTVAFPHTVLDHFMK